MGKGIEKLVEHLVKFQEEEFGKAYDIYYQWIKVYYRFVIDLTNGQAYGYSPEFNMYLPKAEPDIAVIGKILDSAHQVCAFSFRRAFLRGIIIGKGLEEHADDILTGMNASCGRVLPEMPEPKTPQETCSRTDKVSRALLKFGIDYIERWEMYNKLFSEKNS